MFEPLITKIAAALKKHGIAYMVIGGQAVLAHGEPRLTRDIDITLGVDTDQLSVIVKIARFLKLRLLVDNHDAFAKKTKVLPAIQDSTGVRVDFIFSSSEFEKAAMARAVSIRLGRASVKFASVEDLIILKIVAGRPRDIEDVKSVILKNRNFDKKYIERWLKEFDKALDADYRSEFKSILREIS